MLQSLDSDAPLPLPSLPQEIEPGVIDVSHPNMGEDLVIRIDHYYPKNKDQLIGYANSVASKPPITVSEPFDDYYDLKIPFNELPDDDYEIYYTVLDAYPFSNPNYSLKKRVKIINSPSVKYPAPTYPDAQGAIVDFETILASRGLFVRIAYRSMAVTDKVIFTWQGNNIYGDNCEDSIWQKEIPLTADDVSRGFVHFIIPIDFVTCLGQGGTGSGQYSVNGKESARGSVLLTLVNISTVMLNVTSGAPLSTPDLSLSDARNFVNVFSPPGKEMVASLSEGKFFENKKQQYSFHANVFGRADFSVISEQDANVVCSVTALDNSMEPGIVPVIFNSWNDGDQAITAYAYTTSALADGKATCTVYVMIDNKHYTVNSLKIDVNGNASIVGFYDDERQHGALPVPGSGMVIFSVCNSIAEKNQIQVTAENGKGSVTFSIMFKKFPDF